MATPWPKGKKKGPRPAHYKKSGPKPVEIDWEQIAQYFSWGMKTVQAAARLGITDETLVYRYNKEKPDPDCENLTQFKAKSRSRGEGKLLEWQFKKAEKGNTDMLKWLGREFLGQGASEKYDPLDLRNSIVEGQERKKQQDVIDQEVQRRVALALQQAGVAEPDVAAEQLVLHQRLGREEDQVSDELGAEGVVRELSHVQHNPESQAARLDDVFSDPKSGSYPLGE